MPQSRSVKIGLSQYSCTDDKAQNQKKAIAAIENLVMQGAQIICLQELFSTLYFCQRSDAAFFDLAEEIPGETYDIIQKIAMKHRVVIVASLFEKRVAGLYHNTVVVFDADGSYLGKYRKMHIPEDPSFGEKYYFTPGDLGFCVFQTQYAKIAPLICWDQWYPEAARAVALKGAEIIFYPTAIGRLLSESADYGQAQYQAWKTIQTAHAIANGVFVASPNRVGQEGDIEFFGGSFVADPFGRILHQASATQEENFVVDCDLNLIEATRRDWPFLRDRRVESYQTILKRFDD